MLKNTSRETTLSSHPILIQSILGKAKGLMFCTRVINPLIFVFSRERAISLHMMFVLCTIDVMLLDSNKRVVELKKSLRPFTLYNSRKRARYVIELAEGEIARSMTRTGDKIYF
ncbi:DUF192 domain-containing protein [Candidatus Woesearchaeota archaeon]|nr:DUF192 domain-containing protein [Candidatus Woesearchaeota archaeon]